MDLYSLIVSCERKRIASLHPGIGILLLESVLYSLTEKSVSVEDTVAVNRKVQCSA